MYATFSRFPSESPNLIQAPDRRPLFWPTLAVRIATGGLLLIGLSLDAKPVQTEPHATEQIIAQRQQAFEQIGALAEQSEQWLDESSVPWAQLEQVSAELVANMAIVNGGFPAGSAEGSKSKIEIWQNPLPFQQLMAEMAQGSEMLNEAVQMQNRTQAERGLEQINGTCRACHRSYRARW